MSNFNPYFLTLNENQKRETVEAIIFSSDESLSIEILFNVLFEKDEYEKHFPRENQKKLKHNEFQSIIFEKFSWTADHVTDIIKSINEELKAQNRAFEIVNFAGGYQFATRNKHGKYIAQLLNTKSKKKLSNAGLEALAIIAYRQPISKSGVEQIRGVNSNEVVNTLIEKNLVKIVGRSENLGKALLYGTTTEFLKLFGLSSLQDLPKLKELDEIANLQKIREDEQQVLIEVKSK